MATTANTQETKQDAAAEKKAKKAAAERARRARIKALETAELDPKTELTAEQKERAENAPGGMRKKALAHFILEGKGSKEQQEDGKAERTVADKVDRAKRTSKDPEAAELAAKTGARAKKAGRNSAFLPKDARAFLDILKERKALASDLLLGALPPAEEDGPDRDLDVSRLAKFVEGGEKDTDVRRFLKDLSEGTRLYGGKLELFLLQKIDEERA